MYKGDRIGVAFLFCITTVSSIAICMTCIGVSFYVIVRSQYSALEVSVRHTVVLVRHHTATRLPARTPPR